MKPEHRKALAFLAGTLAGVHGAVKQLEAEGVEGLDPVACAMEDMGDLLTGLGLELLDVESSAAHR